MQKDVCKTVCAHVHKVERRLFISVCNMGLKENSFVSIAVLLSRLSRREAGIGSGSGSMHPVKVKKTFKKCFKLSKPQPKL